MKILLVNQAFYPDVVSTAQHLTDLALDLAAKLHDVFVLTGNRGYDDHSKTFAENELYCGIKIQRLCYSAFGKKNKWARLLDSLSFNFKLCWKWLCLPRQDVVVALTSPPMMPFLASVLCRFRKEQLIYWVMDMNPDEAIAAGWLKEKSITAGFMKWLNRQTFKNSRLIIALDQYMKTRIVQHYGAQSEKVVILPPWAHDDHLHPVNHHENLFHKEHGFQNKFVVMYSGNHSVCHPLDTLLKAALHYKDDPSIVFCFIGGGARVREVAYFKNNNRLGNILQFPYQSLDRVSESLSAADLHIVVMGDPFVSIVHPCKIYGVLSVGRPFVFVGPKASAIGDLLEREQIGDHVNHGDSVGLVQAIERIRLLTDGEKSCISERELTVKNSQFSRKKLSARLVNLVENSIER